MIINNLYDLDSSKPLCWVPEIENAKFCFNVYKFLRSSLSWEIFGFKELGYNCESNNRIQWLLAKRYQRKLSRIVVSFQYIRQKFAMTSDFFNEQRQNYSEAGKVEKTRKTIKDRRYIWKCWHFPYDFVLYMWLNA